MHHHDPLGDGGRDKRFVRHDARRGGKRRLEVDEAHHVLRGRRRAQGRRHGRDGMSQVQNDPR